MPLYEASYFLSGLNFRTCCTDEFMVMGLMFYVKGGPAGVLCRIRIRNNLVLFGGQNWPFGGNCRPVAFGLSMEVVGIEETKMEPSNNLLLIKNESRGDGA